MRGGRSEGLEALWLPVVEAFVRAYREGEHLSAGAGVVIDGEEILAPPPLPGQGSGGPLVLLCSPHPDDEALTGGLPLRLARELKARVINLAVTLGSNPARQAARRAELSAACAVLGFACRTLATPPGFALKAGSEGQGWPAVVEGLADLIEELRPDLVLFPHPEDHHPAHVATNHLVTAALVLASRRQEQPLKAVETEYWRPMAAPNLLLGLSPQAVAQLLAAVACHRGEVLRNPYHLTLPARLLDNVRRGAELVNASQAGRPPFLFGELYRVSLWRQGRNPSLALEPGWLGPEQGLSSLINNPFIETEP